MGKKMGLFLVIALLFLCSGCVPSVELNERAIVQAIGVDSVKGGYRVSLQIFSPGGGDGPTEIDAGQQNAKMITAEGKTISDAIQQATLEQGRQIFYGHNRLLVIGESTVKKGISNILPFFNSGYQSRPSINVMAAEGTAEGILSANIQQGIIPAESLEKMVENYSENGSVMQTKLMDVITSFYNESRCVTLPKVALTGANTDKDSSEGDDQQIEKSHLVMIKGSVVLKNGIWAGNLDEDQTRGLVWMSDNVKETLLVIPYRKSKNKETEQVSLNIYNSRTKITPEIRNGKMLFRVTVHAVGKINEMSLNTQFSFYEDDLIQIEQAAERTIQNQCESAFSRVALNYHADVLNFGARIRQKSGEQWKKIQDHWPERIAEVLMKHEIHVDVDRLGLQTNDKQAQ